MPYSQQKELACNGRIYAKRKTFGYIFNDCVLTGDSSLHNVSLGRPWQPYASVGMVWNILNETKFTANDVRLPEMSIKPYVEYGVGLQKNWQDKCSGFIQAMLRNGGRNGIALTFGFKWALGRERKPIERVQSDNKLVKSIDMPSINNTAQKLAQLQCNASSLNDKLNILTTEQIVQRANMTQMTISKVCKK